MQQLAKHLVGFDRDVKGSLSTEELRQVVGGMAKAIGDHFSCDFEPW